VEISAASRPKHKVLESACTLAEMDSETWDSWWAERGLDGLKELLVAEWAPIWPGSDQPSRPDLHSPLRADRPAFGHIGVCDERVQQRAVAM
jgi:hypothetical protein